jgi:DNA-binding transcriptional MerR regulator
MRVLDQELMSKKELLDLTGISYGQLYRWKRKNLIPENWFIRKSTFTGQETFFPKEKMLQRIEQIKDKKDGLSLDEMADMFSPNPSDILLSRDEVVKRNIVTRSSLDIFLSRSPDTQDFPFERLLSVYLVDIALRTGDINLDEGAIILQTMEEHYAKYELRNCSLMFIRKLGVSTCLLMSTPGEIHFDGGSKVVFQFDLSQCVEDLKMKLA